MFHLVGFDTRTHAVVRRCGGVVCGWRMPTCHALCLAAVIAKYDGEPSKPSDLVGRPNGH
jgi:hypothetical protein